MATRPPCGSCSTPTACRRRGSSGSSARTGDGSWPTGRTGRGVATVVVKLGSSVVADDAGEVRTELLEALCDAVAERHRTGDEVVVVTSGAIARGMRLMELSVRPRGMEELQAASAVGQGKLYRHYDELLQARGVPSAQVLLTFFDMSARTHYLNARHTLRKLLDWRVVPVINENDTTTTDEISFGDNDFLAAQVAILIGADRLVLLTDTGGLYTADPRSDEAARLVEEVRDVEELDGYDIGLSSSPLGSGGMRSKVVAAEMATAAGIPVAIASGVEPGEAARAPAHRRRRGASAPRAWHQPAAGRRGRRGGGLRGGRRGGGPLRGPARGEGHRRLLRGGARAREGPQDGPGARVAAASHRGGCAPGLLRPRVNTPSGHPDRRSDGNGRHPGARERPFGAPPSPYDREILKPPFPPLGALAAEPLYLLADTAMVGHLGTEELAALAIAGSLIVGAFTLFNFLTYGTTAQVARLSGAAEHEQAGRLAAQAPWLAPGLGLLLTGLLAGLAGALV